MIYGKDSFVKKMGVVDNKKVVIVEISSLEALQAKLEKLSDELLADCEDSLGRASKMYGENRDIQTLKRWCAIQTELNIVGILLS